MVNAMLVLGKLLIIILGIERGLNLRCGSHQHDHGRENNQLRSLHYGEPSGLPVIPIEPQQQQRVSPPRNSKSSILDWLPQGKMEHAHKE